MTMKFWERRTLLKKWLTYSFVFIFIVELTFGLSLMYVTGNIMKKQINQSNSEYLRQILLSMDEILMHVNEMAVNLGTNGLVTATLNSARPPLSKFSEYMDILSMLHTFKNTNQYVDTVSIYLEHDGKVLTSDSAILNMEELTDTAWLDVYRNSFHALMNTRPVASEASNRPVHVLTLVKSLPLTLSDRKLGALVIRLSEEALQSSINADRVRKREEIMIIDRDGMVISGRSQERLYQSYSWSREIAGATAPNGSMIREVDGVKSMVTYHSSPKYDWKIVSSLPYSDLFLEYNQLRLWMLGINTAGLLVFLPLAGHLSRKLYKPISRLMEMLRQHASFHDEKGKDDMQHINESINRILHDKESAVELLAQLKPAARETFIRDIVAGEIADSPSVHEGMEMLGLHFEGELFIAVLIEADRRSGEEKGGAARLDRSVGAGGELLQRLEGYLAEQGYTYAAAELDPGIAAVISFSMDSLVEEDNIFYLCLDFKERLAKETGCSVSMGIGRPVDEFVQAGRSFREARRALRQKPVFARGAVVRFQDSEKHNASGRFLKNDDLEYILKNLRSGDIALCIAKTDEVIDVMTGERVDTAVFFHFFRRLLNLISYTLSEMGYNTEAVLGNEAELEAALMRHDEQEEIKQWLQGMFAAIGRMIGEKTGGASNELIDRVKKYMDEHYGADLSVTEIADKVYLHPHYLGKLFKKTEGITWNEYLTKVRMEKAREMVLTTHMKVAEIAEAVGLGSSQYFIYCFKNAYGITPKKMRESSSADLWGGDEKNNEKPEE
ncbi:MAG: AraC family transcriptional regulator [Paenibacillaceae bacterium]|jgi:AraC-like DNA-binding protein|nr:AraC family transcriptional regulator [Paenibacillaceae bacterium]